MLTEITLENFRCFHEQQTARLAPLTLLVGENSTGKTSFLASIPVLTSLANDPTVAPNFRQRPYDLGSFNEIAYTRGARSGRAESFEIGFEAENMGREFPREQNLHYRLKCAFRESGAIPRLVHRYARLADAWVNEEISHVGIYTVTIGTKKGCWTLASADESTHEPEIGDYFVDLLTAESLLWANRPAPNIMPLDDSPAISSHDLSRIGAIDEFQPSEALPPPFAAAPARSGPHRTYETTQPTRDSTGANVPMYLADLAYRDRDSWRQLKERVEQFGRDAGLFDEIHVRQLGKSPGDPFQVQIRKGGRKLKGSRHNLVDVGYGVSQVLPLVIELLRGDATQQFLLQQPEVHLHPSAQAALGSLCCQIAATGKQLIIETHSDYLIDRVRMDVRDGKTGLKPEDVSVLYFERTDLDVQIHSLRFDAQGNVLDVPPGYRQFFLEEVNRSLRI